MHLRRLELDQMLEERCIEMFTDVSCVNFHPVKQLKVLKKNWSVFQVILVHFILCQHILVAKTNSRSFVAATVNVENICKKVVLVIVTHFQCLAEHILIADI